MVQRTKGVGKLGIQADNVKSEKLATSLRPSSSLHHDGKIIKRKVKKSRSLSLDGLNPSSPLREISPPQPGRPPPPNSATPQRQSQPQGKARRVLPNYMKSTSSSDARKENSQVTHPLSTPAASITKISRRRCSAGSPRSSHNSGAGKYLPSSTTRTSRRSSSLKLVRTLTKAPSFKPARLTSARRCTQVVVCADVSIQKATCSSTLKESEYPEYLVLNPGGTEAEGTSVFKVCPYTYCSLNGHRHAQLPPLKRFVAARRRLLKAQKSAKVVPVSPAGFCCGSPGDKPASRDAEIKTIVEIFAKSEDGSSNSGGVDCSTEGEAVSEESEDDHCGDCQDAMTSSGAYNENGDDGWEVDIDLDEKVEGCPDAMETEISSILDSISREKKEPVARDLDEVYSLIMIQKEKMHQSISRYEIDGDESLEGEEDLRVQTNCIDDDWDSLDYPSSELNQRAALSLTEAEDNYDEVTPDNNISDCSSRNQTGAIAAVVEVGGFLGEFSQEESEVSSEGLERSDVIGAQTISNGLLLQTEADEADGSDSPGLGCFNPQIDAVPTGESFNPPQGLAEEMQVTAEPLVHAKSVIAEEVGLEDEEKTSATEQASDTEIPTQLQIAGTSSEDSGGVDKGFASALTQGQENDESIKLIKTTADDLGDADNLEGYRTDELDLNEDLTGQSKKMETNKAWELSRTSPVQNASALTGTKSNSLYSRRNRKPHEDLTDPCMIWGINRREKFDVPGEELPGFNPRDPNYLPMVPDPEAEKVDLRHQMIDDRRNSEEWMIDYALQQAVSKLAPARKKKVELLVEAFERVTPVSQFETHMKSSSIGITRGGPIQACS